MKRKLRPAVELASDIGAKAADLHAHGDEAALEAIDFLCHVNPDVFSWLLDRLMAVKGRRTLVQHGVTCPKKAHVGTGHLHGPDDDTPYNVDGLMYCGRCHQAMDERRYT